MLSTADAIQPATLKHVTEVATAYEPGVVGSVVLELFAEVIGGRAEDLGTAGNFFGALIEEMGGQRRGSASHVEAQVSILQWLPTTDPLRIAQDPECGYALALAR
ncbi:hypothetical protein [Bradyrhizobium viridifuturi]|uniref:hypothetical protein n=1 Tax=Bradyrhizobium viridifuturi TaxID=1654716 RepID=UPI00067F7178|nr:hypothetical protein [Bradyrhizobium viridifuturi]